MRWGAWALAVATIGLAALTAVAWSVTDQDVRDWCARHQAWSDLDLLHQAYWVVVWRDTVRYLGPAIGLLLGVALVRVRRTTAWARRVADDLRALARRHGPTRLVLLVSVLAAAPVWLVIGVSNVADDARVYADVRCPPDVIMTSDFEQNLIETVRRKTPDTARLLLVTDDQPWFLSYYLYPRVLFRLADEWDGPRPMPPGWLQSKRVDWVLVQTRGRRARLMHVQGYRP